MKLSKCYKSTKFTNSIMCEGMPYEQLDPITGAKTIVARKYLSLQSVDEVNKLIQSGAELKWDVTEHQATGCKTYKFSIKK